MDDRIQARDLGWHLVSTTRYLQLAGKVAKKRLLVGFSGTFVMYPNSQSTFTTSQKTIIKSVMLERAKLARARASHVLGRPYKLGMELSVSDRVALEDSAARSIDRVYLMTNGARGNFLIVDGHHTLAAHTRLGLPVLANILAPYRADMGEDFVLGAPTDKRFV